MPEQLLIDNPLVQRIASLFLLPRGESLPQEKYYPEYLVDTCYGNCNGYPVIAHRSEAGNMIRLQTITAHIDQCREGITLNQRPQNFRAGFRKRVRAIHGRSPRYVYSFPRSIRKCGAGWVSNFASFIGFLSFLRGFAHHTDICHIHQIPFPTPHSSPRDSSRPGPSHENPLRDSIADRRENP